MSGDGVREWIAEAVKALGVEDAFRLVEPHRYQAILGRIIDFRTHLDRCDTNALWWWESLREPVASVYTQNALVLLPELVPAGESIWFVAEAGGASKQHGNFWLYECSIEAAIKVLHEAPAFEYYLVARKCDWLVCENHHNMLVVSGETMLSRLAAVVCGRG